MPEIGIMLDEIVFDELSKGKIIRVISQEKDKERIVHYEVREARELTKEIYKVYSNKNATKKDFFNVVDKIKKKTSKDIDNFFEILNQENENFFRVIERKEKGDEVTIKLKKIDSKEKLKLVSSIAKQLAKKVKPNQLVTMFEQGMRKLNDVDKLKKISEKLKKKKVKVKEKRGCFYFDIDGEELFLIS
jgi:hypothetical protein